jgi:hypothetical protein
MASPAASSALASTWNRFRVWDLTAVRLRTSLDRWRVRTLILAVAGAVLVTLGQQLGSLSGWAGYLGTFASVGGAIAIAVSAYFAGQALSNENVQNWTKSRSAAESLKAATYLYRTGIPPFDGADRDAKLVDRRAAIEEAVDGIEPVAARAGEEVPNLSSVSVDNYITLRVNDQIDGFYRKRAAEYQQKTASLRQLIFWLGAVPVILGAASAKRPSAAAWSAVVATVIASLTSYVQGQRYQALSTAYLSTARRLEMLRDKWAASSKSDDSKKSFIQSCEDTMALENGAWVTQWSQQKPADQKPSNTQ